MFCYLSIQCIGDDKDLRKMNEKRKPSASCSKCGELSFAIYLSKEGLLCGKCEDKRRERREKELESQHLLLTEERGHYGIAQIPS